MRLIGFGDGGYTSKRDGRRKEGYRFYFMDVRDNVAGYACEQVGCQKSVGDTFLQTLASPNEALGKEFQVLYNWFGSAVGFQLMVTAPSGRK